MSDPEIVNQDRLRSLMRASGLLLLLFGVTALLAFRVREVGVASVQTADVRQDLPEKVGEWKSEQVFFCQNDQCARSFPESELEASRICPLCGGVLDLIALGERTLLPADTKISRRIYENIRGDAITVAIVLSGSERRSIHRPQQCLPAQGFSIESSSVMTASLLGRSPLQLTLIKASRAGGKDNSASPRLLLAYWFVGGGHETHDHIKRAGYMAWDNLIHGVRPRWAYVSLQIASGAGEQVAEDILAGFVQQLYPLLKPTHSLPQ
jgi:EpsI family protein